MNHQKLNIILLLFYQTQFKSVTILYAGEKSYLVYLVHLFLLITINEIDRFRRKQINFGLQKI
jgi:membrane-bound acyltransferase YfiQ involved in biofilm formation